jgi:D-alanyl-D-alanine carboxypeptidase/D-alanyl-D-alanine-endopeptidase (penicillin-binding protein 4)
MMLRTLAFPVLFLLGGPGALAEDRPPDLPAGPSAEVIATAPAALDVEALLRPLASDRVFRQARLGAEVVDVESGTRVFGHEADRPMVPASTMKVVTAAVALRQLGPAYRFTTGVYADGPIDATGTLQGNLYIQGRGDPTLVVERLWKLVLDLKLEGVTKVSGDLVFDATFFDDDPVMPGWTKEADIKAGTSYFATSSALSLNHNTVTFVVAPAAEVGQPARIVVETPATGHVTFESTVLTTAPGSRHRLLFEREATATGVNFRIEGTVPSDAPVERERRSVLDPTAHFIAVFRDLAAAHGITVGGKVRRAPVPGGAKLLFEARSAPLTTILMDMNKYSNNFIAEQVLKAIAAEATGKPGTVAAGLEQIATYLDSLGVKATDLRLVNGSGLSRDARLTPAALNKVMVDMARNPKLAHEFSATLALAGWDGTMWSRLSEDPGRVRGKTGTLDGVHCLTGYVDAADGRTYAFTFLVNDLRDGSGPARRLHDRMLRSLIAVEQP